MSELDEFAEALMAQLSVEINEEKEIDQLAKKIKEDRNFAVEFDSVENISQKIFPDLVQKVSSYTGLEVSNDLSIEYLGLDGFKRLKGKKVFTDTARKFVDELFDAVTKNDLKKISEIINEDVAKFLVYSTYVKSYISKISTTYGDYLDSKIYLNMFILGDYPKIILYKQGPPYEVRSESVKSGYLGALKMTILEEIVHSVQTNLQKLNMQAVIQVNAINEELAKTILALDDKIVTQLTEYLQLQFVPEEFKLAKRANLFFMLNPDNFITNVMGPDVMTYTKVEIDPKITEFLPILQEIYQRWLKPIQSQHAIFTTMEGMAEFVVQQILKDDTNFQNYLTTFAGTDYSAYSVKKSIGKE
ncbi:MAG TPA: hypothetical protein EYG64_00785, partial [Candidatus Nitrosopelagicus sp.]|nr:hypothetical protein [Candidatus Nitrosopelagicus sp.]